MRPAPKSQRRNGTGIRHNSRWFRLPPLEKPVYKALQGLAREFNPDGRPTVTPNRQREIVSVALIMAAERVNRDRQGFHELLAEYRCYPNAAVETFFTRC